MSQVVQDVMRVAVRASQRVLVSAKGHPAVILAYGVASALTLIGVSVYRSGRKVIEYFQAD